MYNLDIPEDAMSEIIRNMDIKSLFELVAVSSDIKMFVNKKEVLDMLAEVHSLPYSDSISELGKYSLMSTQKLFELSAELGDLRVFDAVAASKDLNLESAGELAARNGRIDVIDRLLTMGASNYKDMMVEAAEGGHEVIIDHILEFVVNGQTVMVSIDPSVDEDYNEVMGAAARNGHKDIVDKMIELGGDYYGGAAMVEASRGGHQTLVNYMLELQTNDIYNNISYGDIEYVDEIINMNVEDYEFALSAASEGGHQDIVNQMYKLIEASEHGLAMLEDDDSIDRRVIVDMIREAGDIPN